MILDRVFVLITAVTAAFLMNLESWLLISTSSQFLWIHVQMFPPSRRLLLQDGSDQNWISFTFGLPLNLAHQFVQYFLVSVSDGLNLHRGTGDTHVFFF